MTYDPTIPAPIYDEHIRRITAYLTAQPSLEARPKAISESLGIPAGSLANRYFLIRARAAGIDRYTRRRGHHGRRVYLRLMTPPGAP